MIVERTATMSEEAKSIFKSMIMYLDAKIDSVVNDFPESL
jgi:hypothetical protein